VQREHEAEKKVAALTAKVSSLPGVQSKEQSELSLRYLTIIGFFFGCATTVLICLVLLLGNKSMWNYYAIVFLIDGCEFLTQSFNLPTILLCHICCVLCGIGMADIVVGCYACLIVRCDGMLKLNGTGDCET